MYANVSIERMLAAVDRALSVMVGQLHKGKDSEVDMVLSVKGRIPEPER